VAVVALVTHLTSLFGTFHYDDFPTIVKNPSIPRLDFMLRFLWEPEHFSGIVGNAMYRPVLLVTFQFDWLLYGFSGTIGWHATNLLFHVLNSVLVFFFTRRVLSILDGRERGIAALLAGLVFAIHPIHTEVVNSICSRSGAIATAGFLSSLLVYLRVTRGPGGVGHRALLTVGALLLFLTGLGGKEIAIAVVPTVLLFELLDRENGSAIRRLSRALLRGLPFILVAVAYLAWRQHVLSENLVGLADRLTAVSDRPDPYAGGGRTVLENLFTQARVFWIYARLTVFPVGLAVDRFVRVSTTFTEPAVLMSVAGLLAALGLLLSQWRRRSAITFAGLIVFFGLAPTSSLIPLNVVMNEHRMYLPGVGVAMLAGMLLAPFLVRHPRIARNLLVAAGLVLVALTIRRSFDWHSPERLWEANVAVSPESYRGHNQLGAIRKAAASRMGRVPAALPLLDEAIREFDIAADLYPVWYAPRFSRAMAYIDRAMISGSDEDWERALSDLSVACELSRREPWRARYWIANIHGLRKNTAAALADFRKLGDEDRNERGERKSIYLYPIASLQREAGNLVDAERVYREIISNYPWEADAYAGLAKTLRTAGRDEEAEETIRDLLAGPAKPVAARLAAAAYYFGVDRARARAHFETAIEKGHTPTAQEMQKYLGGG